MSLKPISRARDLIYITRNRARELGFTHEGRLFGVPAWMLPDDRDPDSGTGVPKLVPLVAWVIFCEAVADLATNFMYEDQVIRMPIHIGERIDEVLQA